ncbi:cell division protein FtsQ/DivIB [Geomonas subterranea]|uniref:Cell division protein FtsQ n=1 Tax=Geomonas subterranea TaxID=2847989 RepID=A0ABX8LH18_9BACT|nr:MULTISPECIES: FtsQ-type POTRA domain-containing protein [Geomonas]QXE89513.1 cell division protein FtsQ/DivIB [Geomonas subterranea]QXM08372.1 cell division protein FtsQ/DivIB [Geomonas subterranea]
MRDLHAKKQRVPHNRVKKAPKERKPINWGPILKWLSRGIGASAICAVAGFGGWKAYGLVSRTTLLRLETIEVSQLKKVSRDEIITLAGVRPGDSMLGLDLKTIMARLSKDPWLEQVQVRRYFPHTLSITASERTPQAVANVGCLYYLDEKGVLFKSLSEGDRLDFPLITGITEEDLAQDPKGSQEALKNALQLIATLRSGSVFTLADISEIHYSKGYGFTLFTMQGGVPVKLGNGDFSQKLARLSNIYRDLKPQMQALDYIDLDYIDKIIVKKV